MAQSAAIKSRREDSRTYFRKPIKNFSRLTVNVIQLYEITDGVLYKKHNKIS
jgi:hypothetical protein